MEEAGQQVEEDAGHYSDTTASAPGIDDEGSLGGDEGETGGKAEGGMSAFLKNLPYIVYRFVESGFSSSS